jgi:hypothetical protein
MTAAKEEPEEASPARKGRRQAARRRAGVGPPPKAGGFPQAAVSRRSAAEQCEDGEHAAVVVFGVGQVKLLEDCLDVPFHGPRAEVELLGDRTIGPAFGNQRQDRALPVGELVQRGALPAADEALDDLRVERGSPCDPLDRVEELGDVADAVFEQVPDTTGAEARQRLGQVVEQLRPHAPKVAGLLEDGETDLLAFYAFPAEHWAKLRFTNPPG